VEAQTDDNLVPNMEWSAMMHPEDSRKLRKLRARNTWGLVAVVGLLIAAVIAVASAAVIWAA
jgi:hypothetical protein